MQPEAKMKNNALSINPTDNVVIALQALKKGDVVILENEKSFEMMEDIQAGHKIALENIASGEKIYRYGEPIVEATRTINRGEWVHVHNTRPIPGDMTA
jgi:altronate hydrolase